MESISATGAITGNVLRIAASVTVSSVCCWITSAATVSVSVATVVVLNKNSYIRAGDLAKSWRIVKHGRNRYRQYENRSETWTGETGTSVVWRAPRELLQLDWLSWKVCDPLASSFPPAGTLILGTPFTIRHSYHQAHISTQTHARTLVLVEDIIHFKLQVCTCYVGR